MSHQRKKRQLENGDYFESDDSDDEKGHDRKIYKGACSMGQFFLNPCLCLWIALNRSCQRQYIARLQTRLRPVHYAFSIPLLLLLFYFVRSSSSSLPAFIHPLRPRSDYQVNALPIQIQFFINNEEDIGGWLGPARFRKPPSDFSPLPQEYVDFGPLKIQRLHAKHFQRQIHPNDDEFFESKRDILLDEMDKEHISTRYWPDEDMDYEECRRPNWFSQYKPNCNDFHELDVGRAYDRDLASFDEKLNVDSYKFR